jgi:transcription initiation factor TFIID subunit 1, fungi type
MIRFSKLGFSKRKHIKGKPPKTLFNGTKDLSLADNSHSLLLEYSEEYPTMMSNFGMHNRIINYYRRKNMEDTARPRLELGETAVLLPQDKSPFSIFGTVEPGQVTPALHNAMFRAPIFKQQPKPNDFLVIRNTTGVDGSSWYIRNIENLYVVGQELPSVDVPGPHSRKVTTAAKNRLKMISYRKIRKNNPHRLNVSEITAHFPETTDMQNRQKMKEFMQFSKEHREWEMKAGEAIPDEEAVRSMIEPEDVCLLESMQVGVRHLSDAGYASYGKDVVENEDEEEKEGQNIHQQLAPWNTTKNFLHATQGKAMLELHGEGDPSGRGWAFSFIKTSMKGGFKPVGESVEDRLDSKRKQELGGHSYNVAKQQKAYEESITKIWEAQKTSLSTTMEPSEAEVDDAHRDEAGDLFEDRGVTRSEAATPAAWGHHGDDETTSQFSRISASSQRGKVLRITRDVRNQNGVMERQSEVVRDPRVIRQYLRRRRDIEAERVQ